MIPRVPETFRNGLNSWFLALGPWILVVSVAGWGHASADPPPAPVPLGSAIPGMEVGAQANFYAAELEKAAHSGSFNADDPKVQQNAAALAALLTVLAHHEDSPIGNGPKMMTLAAGASTVAQGEASLDELKELTSTYNALAAQDRKLTTPEPAPWKNDAPLGPLMREVGQVNTRLRNNLRRFERKPEDNARMAAMLAAVGQAIIYDDSYAAEDTDSAKWRETSLAMRDAAKELHDAITKRDEPAGKSALLKVTQACDACHAVFAPDQK